ncbi:hypothetical protein ACTXT7_004340 [Hymenolepis weldensis]
MTPPFFPQGLRVNTDADTYVGTLQTIVKPPWIDSVAGGRLPYVFQQDSAPKPRIRWLRIFIIMSHKAYGHLLTHQTLILWIITCEAGRDVVEKEINNFNH